MTNRQLSDMTKEEIIALHLKTVAAIAAGTTQRSLTLKVSEKGGISVYGLGRFPVTLYAASWERLLAPDQAKTILDFITANAALVSRKA